MLKSKVLLATVVSICLASPVVAAPATSSVMVKDPYIAGIEAGRLLFGARQAKDYLEMMPDGSRWPFYRGEEVTRLSDQWSYVTLGAWAATLAYGLLVPDAGKDFFDNNSTSIFRGVVAGSAAITVGNWLTAQQVTVPFFQQEAARRNKEIE